MSPWIQAATVGTPLLVAAFGVIGAVWVKRLSRVGEAALARKANAETISIEVNTARGLVDECKLMMAHQRTDYEARLTATRSELAQLAERTRATETRQQTFLIAVAAHAPWDQAVYAAVRSYQPEFPPPPPLHFDGDTCVLLHQGEMP